MTNESIEVAQARYQAAAHAMQSGVAMTMNVKPSATEPKHLRTGVNSAMVETSTLAWLLIQKGIITEQEWYSALADAMEREKALYERELSQLFGHSVTLG